MGTFPKKNELPWLGTRTHDTLHSRQSALRLSYIVHVPRQLSWLGPNLTSHSTPDEQANHQLSIKEKVGDVHVQYASKRTSHKRPVQRAPVLIKRGLNGARTGLERGENGSARSIARSNGRVYRVGNVEDQRRCCVFSGLGVLKQA